MQGYIRKILFIYAGVNSIVHFGYGPTVLYMMSNTPEQMKVFGLQGFFGWLIFLSWALRLPMPLPSRYRMVWISLMGVSLHLKDPWISAAGAKRTATMSLRIKALV